MIDLKELVQRHYFTLNRVRRQWNQLGRSSDPVDRPAAEMACRLAYRAAGLAEPDTIIWCASPFAGLIETFRLDRNRSGCSVKDPFWLTPWGRWQEELGFIDGYRIDWPATLEACLFEDEFFGGIRYRIDRQALRGGEPLSPADLVEEDVDGVFLMHLGDQVKEDLTRLAKTPVARLTGISFFANQGEENPAFWQTILGQIQHARWGQVFKCNGCIQNRNWAAFFDALGKRGYQVQALQSLIDLAKWCLMFWPYKHLAVLVDRPSVVHRDQQGRFHHAQRKAVEYADGWGFSAWHGVRVPEQLIHHPEHLTVPGILAESNIEVRRVMIERVGIDRLLSSTRARRLDQDPHGGRTLYRLMIPDDEAVVGLRLRCPSTGQVYFVRVPPYMKTCTEAVAWTFGLDQAADYRAKVET